MAQTVQLPTGAKGKLRSFWGCFGLSIITLGIYYYYWYYKINDEVKEIGRAKGDEKLIRSNPINSLLAIVIGGYIILPPFISLYRTNKRIKRAEKLGGVSYAVAAESPATCSSKKASIRCQASSAATWL